MLFDEKMSYMTDKMSQLSVWHILRYKAAKNV